MKKLLNILVLLTTVCILAACGGSEWQKQYDLGVKYMSEGNYEEAIIAFTAAIEIDEKRPEAYIALADVYVQQGDYEKAKEILQQGLEKTGSNEDIAAKLEEVSSGRMCSVYIAPEIPVSDVDWQLGEDRDYFESYPIGAYKICDEDTGELLTTFSLPVDMSTNSGVNVFYEQNSIEVILQTPSYLIMDIWQGPEEGIYLCYDVRNDQLKELPGDYYRLCGEKYLEKYLLEQKLAFDSGSSSYFKLCTLDGEVVDTILEQSWFLDYNVVGDNIYYAFTNDEEYAYGFEAKSAEFEIWVYNIKTGEKQHLRNMQMAQVKEIGEGTITYYASMDDLFNDITQTESFM